ncbi:MAG: PDZ domain-containing protein [Ignavibacteria bacterium]|nr:PDZ domain-containing protein [Ignavibacteria bacterium]
MKKFFFILIILTIPFGVGVIAGKTFFSTSEKKNGAIENIASLETASDDSQNQNVNDNISNSRQNAITNAVAKVSPAVIGINVIEVREYITPWGQMFGNDPFFRQFFGNQTFKQEVKGLGSGFIISEDGYILTNDHVAGNATKIEVILTNGKKYNAQLVGTDLVSDVALLKIDGHNFPFVKLGNSDDILIGEWVIALGNPFGLFEISDKPTVTVGVVSAVDMNLRAEAGRYYRGMIQTDAAINSGNSGGALVNSLGEVIGINSVIYTPNQGNIGLGFAIPINRVKTIMNELRKSGKVERSFWTGLDVQNIDAHIARYFRLQKTDGVIVTDVKQRSPANRAGFEVGDVIIEVNGEKISDEESIKSAFSFASAGQVMKVKVFRDGQYFDLQLKLEKR